VEKFQKRIFFGEKNANFSIYVVFKGRSEKENKKGEKNVLWGKKCV